MEQSQKNEHMKKLITCFTIMITLLACGSNNETSTKDLDAQDSTSTIDTVINQDTLTDYDGKRL